MCTVTPLSTSSHRANLVSTSILPHPFSLLLANVCPEKYDLLAARYATRGLSGCLRMA
jgi:hypothetical protein